MLISGLYWPVKGELKRTGTHRFPSFKLSRSPNRTWLTGNPLECWLNENHDTAQLEKAAPAGDSSLAMTVLPCSMHRYTADDELPGETAGGDMREI